MHYKHLFLRGTYGFNQFFSGSEHYTDICYAYTGNVIIFTFHYKREFLICLFYWKEKVQFLLNYQKKYFYKLKMSHLGYIYPRRISVVVPCTLYFMLPICDVI